MTPIEIFFKTYEQGANTFDPDLVTAQYADSFLAADPNGAQCMRNDDAFRKAFPERKAFFRKIGFKSAKVLGIQESPLDANYTAAKVHWLMVFEKDPGRPREFRFFITYMLFGHGEGMRIVFYLSHEDEQKAMRDGGLID